MNKFYQHSLWRRSGMVRCCALLAMALLLAGAVGTAAAASTIGLTGQPVGPQLTTFPVPANARIATPNGTGEACTLASPCSPSQALRFAVTGDTIVFRGGVYRMGGLAVNKNVTLQPYHNEAVTFKGSEVVTNWVQEGNVWKTTWQPRFPLTETNIYWGGVYTRDMVWIDGMYQQPFDYNANVNVQNDVTPGRYYYNYSTSTLYIGTNPNGRTVEVTKHANAFDRKKGGFGSGTGTADPSGLTIRGLTFSHYAQGVLRQYEVTGIILEHNRFIENMEGYSGHAMGMQFRNNEVRRNFIVGMLFVGDSDEGVTVENNLLVNNSIEGRAGDSNEIVLKLGNIDNSIVRNNVLIGNQGNGIWMDNGADNTVVVHNFIENTTAAGEGGDRRGVVFEISRGAIIAGNIIINPDKGIIANIGAEGKIYNNTIINATQLPLHIHDRFRNDPGAVQNGPGNSADTHVVNNILWDSFADDGTKSLLMVTSELCGSHRVIERLDSNLYYRSDKTRTPYVTRFDNVPTTGTQNTKCEGQSTNNYETVAAFAAGEGFEQHGLEISNAGSVFKDLVEKNYQLRNGSPALNAGVPLPQDVAAALGWTAGEPVDIGALQTKNFGNLLLGNGSFEVNMDGDKLPDGWSDKKLVKDKQKCNKTKADGTPKVFAREGTCAFRFKGAPGKNSKLSQLIAPEKLKVGDNLTLTVWASGKQLDMAAKAKLVIKYSDSTEKSKAKLSTGADTFDYKSVTGSTSVAGPIAKAKVTLQYKGTKGKVAFDSVTLTKGGSLPAAEFAPPVIAVPQEGGTTFYLP